jgi:hypothetical protein
MLDSDVPCSNPQSVPAGTDRGLRRQRADMTLSDNRFAMSDGCGARRRGLLKSDTDVAPRALDRRHCRIRPGAGSVTLGAAVRRPRGPSRRVSIAVPTAKRYVPAGYYPNGYQVGYDAQAKEYRIALPAWLARLIH